MAIKEILSIGCTLLEVDPSSACQRLFNTALHDLREEISIAGLDIAAEAAKQNGLPPISKAEDIENYSPTKLIDLAYRIGLLSRPEWRRVHRCYEIRRDLEHEDDEYEAGIEDCVYIFGTCVEVILARDPIHLLKVTEIKALIEQASPAVPTRALLDDYESAPQPRQEEIGKFLISVALGKNNADIVQQNSYTFLKTLAPLTRNTVTLTLAAHVQERICRGKLNSRLARVSGAAGVFPYLKQSHRAQFFEDFYEEMKLVGHHWRAYTKHGDLLRPLAEFSGLNFCPPTIRAIMVKWLVLLYIGEPGGQTSRGNVRNVFYSNSGAPLAVEIIQISAKTIANELRALAQDKDIKWRLENHHLSRRFEHLIDLIEMKSDSCQANSVHSGVREVLDEHSLHPG